MSKKYIRIVLQSFVGLIFLLKCLRKYKKNIIFSIISSLSQTMSRKTIRIILTFYFIQREMIKSVDYFNRVIEVSKEHYRRYVFVLYNTYFRIVVL